MARQEGWSPVMKEYDPLKAGSIDGTDTDPHDHGIVRALNAKYRPNKGIVGDPECTIFIGQLHPSTTESTVIEAFDKFGEIKQFRLVRDIVTGFSKGYAFVEYYTERAAHRAYDHGDRSVIDEKPVFVDTENERQRGWIPRRLGGGLGGCKESGQLRFGGRNRPFRKPIIIGEESRDEYRPSRGGRSYRRDEERHSRTHESRRESHREISPRSESRERRTSRDRDKNRSHDRDRNRSQSSRHRDRHTKSRHAETLHSRSRSRTSPSTGDRVANSLTS